MNDRGQAFVYPIRAVLIGSSLALGALAIMPYYSTFQTAKPPSLAGFVVESVLFLLGIVPWLVTHPERLLMASPLLVYVLVLFSRPLVRAKPT